MESILEYYHMATNGSSSITTALHHLQDIDKIVRFQQKFSPKVPS